VNDLLDHTDAQFVIASRQSPRHPRSGPRLVHVRSDLNDIASVRTTLAGAAVVVHCAGPYQSQPPTLLRAAIESGVHYVDLAEDPEFVRQTLIFHEAAKRVHVAIVSGASVVPGLTALLAQSLHFERADSIRTFVAPGTRGSRGLATVRSLLRGVGRPLPLLRGGRETVVRGWSEPEWIEFPPPIGWRLQYLAIATADRDVLSRELEARSIEFKAGSEFSWLNRSLGAVSRLTARSSFPSLERWANTIRKCLKLLGWFGTDAGGVIVEVAGRLNNEPARQQIAVTAAREGERIPSLLAAIAAAALLRGELTARGVVPLSTWLPTAQLFDELCLRGLRVWLKQRPDVGWRLVNDTAEVRQ